MEYFIFNFIIFTAFPKTFEGIGDGGVKSMYLPKDVRELGALSGMPKYHADRTVLISQPMKNPIQQGIRNHHQWQITWRAESRWTNKLMGWSSTADPLTNLTVSFFNRTFD
jgi:hypothetical protein